MAEEETHGLASPPFPLPAITLLRVPNPPGPRVRCLRCRIHKKRCNRVPGEDCDLCQRAGVPCGRSLNAREARILMGRSVPDSTPQTTKDHVHVVGREVAGTTTTTTTDNPYPKSVVESDSSLEGTAFDGRTSLEEAGIFDRELLGDNINRWFEKLEYLLLFQSTLRESQNPLYPQASRSSGASASLGFALKEVARELEWTIDELTKLGDTAVANKDNDRADRIFLHILDGLQSTNCLSVGLQWATLSKMALFYRDIGNEPLSQKALRILSSLSTSIGHTPKMKNSNINPHRMLSYSLIKTSQTLHSSFVKSDVSSVDAVIRSPALYQSIRCENPEVFQATLEAILKGTAYSTAQGAPSGEANSWASFSTATLDSDESINSRDTLGRSPIFVAAALGKESHCKDLFEAGARVDDRDCNGRTLLTVAAGQNLLETAKRILTVKIEEVNPLNLWDTSTPLQAAAAAGHLEMVRLLVQHGAYLRTPCLWDGGKTAVQIARENNHEEIAQELEQLIADLDSQLFLTARDPDFTRDFFVQELPSDFEYSTGMTRDEYLE